MRIGFRDGKLALFSTSWLVILFLQEIHMIERRCRIYLKSTYLIFKQANDLFLIVTKEPLRMNALPSITNDLCWRLHH